MLLCLAPFTGVIYVPFLKQYTQQLQAQPALAQLPFARWGEVLQTAQDWGLLAPHEANGFVRIQPTLPYFLRLRLHEQPEMAAAVETAFQQHYDGYSSEIHELITSKEKEKRQLGLAFANLEYENLQTALLLALAVRRSFFNPYEALFRYLYIVQQFRRALEFSNLVLAGRDGYAREASGWESGEDFLHVMNRAATCHLALKDYPGAQTVYQDALILASDLQSLTVKARANHQSATYHQLGRVAQEQRQWAQARQYLLHTLEIFRAYDDQHNMGITLRTLARLWRDSGDAALPAAVAEIGEIAPAEIETWFRQALADDAASGDAASGG